MAGGVKIQYVGESVSGDQAVVATTLLGRSGSDVPVDYRKVRRADGWKVQDVIIEDVSLIANYRAQFSRILRDYPYTGLIAKIRGDGGVPLRRDSGRPRLRVGVMAALGDRAHGGREGRAGDPPGAGRARLIRPSRASSHTAQRPGR